MDLVLVMDIQILTAAGRDRLLGCRRADAKISGCSCILRFGSLGLNAVSSAAEGMLNPTGHGPRGEDRQSLAGARMLCW